MITYIFLVVLTFTAAVVGDIAVTRIGTWVDGNGSPATVTFTLWFNSGIYQCSIIPNTKHSENYCDSSKIRMIGTDCSSSDTKLLIDNQHPDAVHAGNVFFETSYGTAYSAGAFCVSDDASLSSYSQGYKTGTTCQSGIGESGHIFESVCIGTVYCTPSKQLIHFDTSRPGEAIADALWEDGTSVSTLSYDYNCAELIPYTAGSPLYTGDVIRAIADRRNTGTDRYSVNFRIGSSTAFHFSVRNGLVVRNTLTNNAWGTEERGGGFSEHLRDPTEPIELEFKITDAEYRVSSFGHRIVDYDYDFRMGETAEDITNIELNNLVNGRLFIFRAMPYKKGIALHTGDIIRVVADPSPYAMNVAFRIGNDIAFFFRMLPLSSIVDRTSIIDGSVGTYETEGGWLLGDVTTDSIELDFKFTDTHYEVSYFGRRIAVYDYRFRMGETAEDITDIQWNNAMNGEISIMRRSLIFGFKTAGSIGTGLCGAAAYGMVVIDLYDARGDVYRCHHLGIGCATTYQCIVGLNENVVKLSDASNAEGFTNKLIIRGFEFSSVTVQTVFIATPAVNEGVSALMRGLNIAHFEPTSGAFSASLPEMKFSVEFSDTKARFESQSHDTSRILNLNGKDTQFGIEIKPIKIQSDSASIQQTRDSLVIGDVSFDDLENDAFYAPNDCAWNKVDLDPITTSIKDPNQVDNTGAKYGVRSAVGDAATIAGDAADIAGDAAKFAKMAGKVAKALGPIGDALSIVDGLAGIFGGCLFECGPSDEELMIQRQAEATKRAMEQMTTSVNKLMDCNREHTERKFTALKDEMDGKIDHLASIIEDFSQKVDAQIAGLADEIDLKIDAVYDRLDDRLAVQQEMFDMKLRANEYKIHIENVEVEVAKIQDTLDKLKRQWDHINVLKSSDEAFGEELSSMLQFTMPRFAGVIVRKPESDEFDFFWRLYAEELTVFVLEIMTLRVDIWSLWVHYNANQGGIESIASIIPDYHRDFRDLNGELIVELISLLPYAIYSIIDVESDTTQAIQRMTLTDSFKEIEYRFQPRTACIWIEYTMLMTETDDLFFLGDAEIEGLYDEDMDVCAFNVRKWVIDQVITIDTMESQLYTDTAAVSRGIVVTKIGMWVVNPTDATVTFTLWFNSGIYQCSFIPNQVYSENTCDSSTITTIGTDCSSSDTKLLIYNSNQDGLHAHSFFFETSNGTTVTRYESSSFCVSDGSSLSPTYSGPYQTNTTCQGGSGHIFEAVCIGTVYCVPSKQLIRFNTSRPGQAIDDAPWEDGTNVTTLFDDYNCTAPTSTPTVAPSDTTTPPTAAPSEPTTTPSNYPSESPTTTPYIAVTRIGTWVD
eukprot:1113567_1